MRHQIRPHDAVGRVQPHAVRALDMGLGRGDFAETLALAPWRKYPDQGFSCPRQPAMGIVVMPEPLQARPVIRQCHPVAGLRRILGDELQIQTVQPPALLHAQGSRGVLALDQHRPRLPAMRPVIEIIAMPGDRRSAEIAVARHIHHRDLAGLLVQVAPRCGG